MRQLKLWQRVGPPTWKRSGTIVFGAVLGVLLIGGTAMAANLGLLTSDAPRDRGPRLVPPRPALLVSLPSTEPPSRVESVTTTQGTAPHGGEPATIAPSTARSDDERDATVDSEGRADSSLSRSTSSNSTGHRKQNREAVEDHRDERVTKDDGDRAGLSDDGRLDDD